MGMAPDSDSQPDVYIMLINYFLYGLVFEVIKLKNVQI